MSYEKAVSMANSNLVPWSWVAEKFLKVQEEDVMSKTMPNMVFWKKVTTQGKKEPNLMTAQQLKKAVDKTIKKYMKKYALLSISKTSFKKSILSKFNKTDLDKFEITLYKNGKTVKVSNKKLKFNMKSFEVSTLVDTKEWKSTTMQKPTTNKGMKKIILAGKVQALISFHKIRKHNVEFASCLACKAIKAFIEWEFHFSPNNTKSGTIVVPKVGKLTAEDLMEEELPTVPKKELGIPQLSIFKTKPGQTILDHNIITPTVSEGDIKKTCKTIYDGSPVQICKCGNIQIIWDLALKGLGGETTSGANIAPPDSSALIDKLNETIQKYAVKPYLGIWSADYETGGLKVPDYLWNKEDDLDSIKEEATWDLLEEEKDDGLDG